MQKNEVGKFRIMARWLSRAPYLLGAATITATINGVPSNDAVPTEVGNGIYEFDLTATETNVLQILPVVTCSVFGVELTYQTQISTDNDKLTAQEVRDAMKLTPTVGAPAAGSIDKHLDDIEEDTGTTLPEQTYSYFTDSDRADVFKANVSNLSTFKPATDVVNRVTLVDTVTTNTDMRGTDGALTTLGSNAPADWLNAAAIAAAALNSKGNWNTVIPDAAGTASALQVEILEAIAELVVIGGGAAAGASKVTLRFTFPDGTPIADADTWITNDSDGRNIVDGTYQTNSQGRVTFLLDDGVEYYAWLQKDGVMAIDGEAFTAEEDA